MTEQQYARWMRLAVGLARSGHPHITRARRLKLVKSVADAVDWIACNGIEDIEDWDGSKGKVYVCDRMSDWLYDNGHSHYHRVTDEEKGNKFANQVSCCVRAGFDLAVAPSAGVVGFDVGDLRRACGGRIPKWISRFFDPPLPTNAPDGDALWL